MVMGGVAHTKDCLTKTSPGESNTPKELENSSNHQHFLKRGELIFIEHTEAMVVALPTLISFLLPVKQGGPFYG